MIKIILLLVCLLMCGCENSIITDEAKYKDNAFKDNKEIEPVSDSIANDINKLLEENNLKATFKFVKLENVDDNIKILKEMKKYFKLDKLDNDTINYYLSELKRILTFYKQIIDRYNVNNFYINMLITLYLIVYKIEYLFDEVILKYYNTKTKIYNKECLKKK